MRAAIYGAGAMGTVLGAYITRGGKQIDLITRNTAHVEALRKNGARVTGAAEFGVKVNALTPDEMTGIYDVIFLMTKQRENGKILDYIVDFLADDGVVCTLQNGLPEPFIAEKIGAEHCLGCAVSWGAELAEPGCARLTSSKMTFALGSFRGVNPKTQTVKEYLECAGSVEVESNFLGARWAKLAVNSAFSSLSAVTGMTFGEVAKDRATNNLALGLLNEAFDVAEKCGVEIAGIQGHDIVKIYRCKGRLKRPLALALLPLAMRRHKNIVSGMYYDLKSGKKCDIDYVNGVVSRMGRKFGVETPLNDKVIDVAHAIERKEIEISPENAAFLKR